MPYAASLIKGSNEALCQKLYGNPDREYLQEYYYQGIKSNNPWHEAVELYMIYLM